MGVVTGAAALSGAWDEDRRLARSPTGRIDTTGDGAHVFWFDELPDKRVRFVWDGIAGEPFERVLEQQSGELLVWSLDDRRVAYYGDRAGRFFVGIDGTEAGPYDGITRSVPPTFDPTGGHVAFGAYVEGVPVLILDGEIQGSWRVAPIRPVFARDGQRMAFVAENRELTPKDSGVGYRQWLIVDGVAIVEADGISASRDGIQFSHAGRLAYGLIDGGQFRFVVDGIPGPPIIDANAPTFSPDGLRFAYVARIDGGVAAVVDDRRGPTFEQVGPPVFSPDSRRVAYAAYRPGRRLTVVVDGHESVDHSDLWGNVEFSPDSRRVAYLAIDRGSGILSRFRTTGRAIVDGSPVGDAWDEFTSTAHFSPDSAHVAFAARRSKDHHMVVDGVAGPPYELVSPPRFGSTGRLAYVTKAAGQFRIVFDGNAGPPLDEPVEIAPGEGFVISPDGAHIAAVARVAGGWRPIVDDRIGPPYAGVGRPVFDGHRAIFTGFRSDGVYRVSIPLED